MREYRLVMLIAALGTFLLCGPCRRVAPPDSGAGPDRPLEPLRTAPASLAPSAAGTGRPLPAEGHRMNPFDILILTKE